MREQRVLKEQHGFASDNDAHNVSEDKFSFGNYELVRRIDVGGMGEVYLARQRSAFGREVALKVIRGDLVHDVTARKRFLREAEVSAHLKHEHILPLFEFGEEQGRLFLVTPYIEGGTLAKRLQSGPLSLSEVHQLFTALVQAIAYIHKRGVIHRDLKPNNVLLDREDSSGQVYVRLIDFGIATIQGLMASPPLTTAGNEMGTLAYMAPERLSGIAASSNDIYSLGIILYQMLTGHLPKDGKLLALPQPFDYIVHRATLPNPEDRFASADELLSAFEQAYKTFNTLPKAKPAVVPESPDEDDFPTPRRGTISQQGSDALQEASLQQHAEIVLPEPPPALKVAPSAPTFNGADYSAPTTQIDSSQLSPQQKQQLDSISIQPSKGRTRRKRSLIGFISLAIVALLVVIAATGFFTFQAAISANVTVSPQVHTINSVFTVTAKPTQRGIDVNTSSIPAGVTTENKTESLTGPTTGVECVLGVFDCKQIVDFSDVEALVAQIRPGLRAQLAQDLQRQARTTGATLVGDTRFADTGVSSNPDIGQPGKTVTVSLTDQAGVESIKAGDAQNLARLLLTQQMHKQLGDNYVFITQLTQIGSPVVQGVDANGVVTIRIAAGGMAEYQIPPDQLKSIRNHLKGMKLSAARAFLAQQRGIDAKNVIVHISYGDSIPSSVEQIHVVAVNVNTINLPPVQLPTLKPAATPAQ